MGKKVYKFGGASVKSAEAIQVVYNIIKDEQELIVVLSAMGKTTNRLESIVQRFFEKKEISKQLDKLKDFHLTICKELFEGQHNSAEESIQKVFNYLIQYLEHAASTEYDELYDQIVPTGELLSSKILASFLELKDIKCVWVDARKLIKTNNYYRKAEVDWKASLEASKNLLEGKKITITQGFIGGGDHNKMTTLGREGSDYSAAVIANLVDAESVTVWKDVSGILNADPRYFNSPKKLDKISYREAVELSFHGATIIHPNTIKPLQNKGIPLFVKSFYEPDEKGTLISDDNTFDSDTPIYVFKPNQVLITVSPKDFSYIDEKELAIIFDLLYEEKMEVNSMQNSAINFSFCTDYDETKLDKAIKQLSKRYRVFYNTNLELLTVRHYVYTVVQKLIAGKEILLEQKTRSTCKYVLRSLN